MVISWAPPLSTWSYCGKVSFVFPLNVIVIQLSIMAVQASKGRASFSVDPATLSVERKKYFITRNLEVQVQ